eukprot:6867910-Prorocentrum_lima.AAC.1
MEAALWEGRKNIWAIAPPPGGLAHEMLEHYFRGRRMQGSPTMLGRNQIQRLILGMRNRAAGTDA